MAELKKKDARARYIEQLANECGALANAIGSLTADRRIRPSLDEADLEAIRYIARDLRNACRGMHLVAGDLDERLRKAGKIVFSL